MYPTKSSLPEKVRVQLAGLLQDRLADSIDLKLQAKQAHWNVKGAAFIAIHKLFDKVAEEADEYVDLIAERIVQFGGIAEGTIDAVAERTCLPEYPMQAFTEREHVDALSHSLASYTESVREAIVKCDELGDPNSADIFTEISRSAEKYLWFVETHLLEKSPGERAYGSEKVEKIAVKSVK